MSTAIALESATDASWRVTLEGDLVGVVAVRHEHGEIVVSAGRPTAPGTPHRFDTLQAADLFMSDLVTSLSYLGCDVSQTAEA